MPGDLGAKQMLDREFLEIRRRLLDVAAAFDRIERADGYDDVRSAPRMAMLRQAARTLIDEARDRTERVQMVFSDNYDESWRAA